MFNVTFAKVDDRVYWRQGHSYGDPDAKTMMAGYDDFQEAPASVHVVKPAVNGDWFNKEVPCLPGKPKEPGAYWLRLGGRWYMAEVVENRGTLVYCTAGSAHPAAVWQCRNMDGFIPIERPEPC